MASAGNSVQKIGSPRAAAMARAAVHAGSRSSARMTPGLVCPIAFHAPTSCAGVTSSGESVSTPQARRRALRASCPALGTARRARIGAPGRVVPSGASQRTTLSGWKPRTNREMSSRAAHEPSSISTGNIAIGVQCAIASA